MLTAKFGIEIEGYSELTRVDLAEDLSDNCEMTVISQAYNHISRPYWKIVEDGSIQDLDRGQHGFELVSPILEGEQGLEQAYKLLDRLQAVAGINHSCGLHVHFDARNWSLDQFKHLCLAWINYQKMFDSLQPLSRRKRNNGFCNDFRTVSREDILDCEDLNELSWLLTRGDRYFKINLSSFWRHGTVEFRHHAGSVKPDVVVNWVRLLAKFISNAERLASDTAQKSSHERLEALLQPAAMQSIPSGLKALKEAVKSRLGLSDTKAIKKWAIERGLQVDLRSKAGWAKILLATSDRDSESQDLFSFYMARMSHYERYNLVII